MPAIAFSEFDGLPDALASDRFELLLESPFGAGSNRTFALRCQQVAMPGTTIEPMIVALHGHEYVFRGRRTYPKTLAVTFQETADGAITQAIRTYLEGIVGTESGNGASKAQYAITGTLIVYDQSGNAAITATLDNAWFNELQDTQLDGQSSQPYLASATISYDRVKIDKVPIT